jgi:hypothetical protein
MEFSLHRELKERYAGPEARTEVPIDGYRVDAVLPDRLVEIQHGSLGAISRKVARLLTSHQVLVVKPIVVRKVLVQLSGRAGTVRYRRRSPKTGSVLDLFHDLVHFTRVFPHERLTLEVPLVEIEEWRYPGHGRRRRWRAGDFQIEDQRLIAIHETYTLRTAAQLTDLLGVRLPAKFHTGHLATLLERPRWEAQKVAYCLRETGAVQTVGKEGNAWLYRLPPRRKLARSA